MSTSRAKIEASSTLTRKDNNLDVASQTELIHGKTTMLDTLLFPLYDHLTKNIHLPDILGTILVIYVSLQNTLIGFYDSIMAPIDWNTSFGQFNRYLMFVILQWDAEAIETSTQVPPFFYFYLASVIALCCIFGTLSYFFLATLLSDSCFVHLARHC
jgi:hypothetical protein